MELPNLQSTKFIEEIAIIITAKNLTPTMMSQDFLKFSGIIPQTWELAQKPILNPNFAQLSFPNGINIIAQPGTLTISESIGNKNLSELYIAQIASNYIEKLPHAEYQGFSLNPKIIVPVSENPTAIPTYFTQTLLNQGAWQNIGRGLIQASINLLYQLERCQLSISINQAKLRPPQQNPLLAILFSGNFSYNIATNNPQETINQLLQAIRAWQTDFNAFRDIVSQKFLEPANLTQSTEEATIFPLSSM